MKIKKSTMQTITSLVLIILFSYVMFKFAEQAALNALYEKNNEACINLTNSLLELNKSCFCYYENFATGDSDLDSKTKPGCICECIENGTPVNIGILIPN